MEKTVEEHCANIAFYVNEFLLHEDAVTAEEGALSVGKFLGYWSIRKATLERYDDLSIEDLDEVWGY